MFSFPVVVPSTSPPPSAGAEQAVVLTVRDMSTNQVSQWQMSFGIHTCDVLCSVSLQILWMPGADLAWREINKTRTTYGGIDIEVHQGLKVLGASLFRYPETSVYNPAIVLAYLDMYWSFYRTFGHLETPSYYPYTTLYTTWSRDSICILCSRVGKGLPHLTFRTHLTPVPLLPSPLLERLDPRH